MNFISRSINSRKFLSRRVTNRRKCVRFLNLHEYQSKQLFQKHGLKVQKNVVVERVEDVMTMGKNLKGTLVVKAQILAGGRGVGVFNTGYKGGVHLVKTLDEAKNITKSMLGNNLITKQTSKSGVTVKKVMIAEAIDLDKEYYLSLILDRESGGPLFVGSPSGGVDIEKVAAEKPYLIFKLPVDISSGPKKSDLKNFAIKLGFSGNLVDQAVEQLEKVYNLFKETDALQVEINPWAVTPQGQLVCTDAKINFDDNAKFRQSSIFGMEDQSETDPKEIAAAKFNLNYIALDGNIGCMVNGAGLAMATMDMIKYYKGDPANFLDVGGGATEQQVTEAFKILTSDPKVKAILVNIFGGIMRCDIIATGVVKAVQTVGLKIPLVVRLSGTNVDLGKKIMKESGLPIITADNLDEAAKKATEAIGIKHKTR